MRPYWFPVDCRGGYQPPEPFPSKGKGRFPYQGEMSRRDKRGRGARRSCVTDEGALLDRNPYSNGRAG